VWPNITRQKEPPADSDQWRDVKDKLQHFDPAPGEG
jgi:ferredoxin